MDNSVLHRHPNLLSSDNSILVIVDIQTRLTAAMSEMQTAEMQRHTNRLLQAAKLQGIPVLITEHYPEKLGTTLTDIRQQLPETAQLFAKTGFSCCSVSKFNQALQMSQCQQVILCGIEAHVCILQTALDLIPAGYQPYVVEDAVCSRRVEHKTNALQRLQQQGVTIVNHESVLFEWLKTADHIHFKAVSALLR